MSQLMPGASIGRYVIDEVISRGGTATVFRGHALEQPDRPPVAIKVVDVSVGYEEVANEAELLMDLDHPGLPKVHEAFEENDRLVVIEDLVVGKTLEAYIEENGPLPEPQVVNYALQLASILSYLHDRPRKVIHRDLKPGNIILTDKGLVLVDFGIAKVYQPGKSYDTVYAYTQRYASPEQLLNRGTDERSDIYSFGATLAFLATGVPTPPALGQPPAGSHTITVKDVSPEKLHTAVSPGLRAFILRCMEFDPEKRYQNFRQVTRALQRVQRGLSPDLWRPRPWMIAVISAVMLVGLSTAAWRLWPRSTGGGVTPLPVVNNTTPALSLPDKVALGNTVTAKLEWAQLPEDSASVQWTVKDVVDSYRVLKVGSGPTVDFQAPAPGQYTFEATYRGHVITGTLGVYADFSLPSEGLKDTFIQLAPSGRITQRTGVKYAWQIQSPTGQTETLTSDTGKILFRLRETGIYRITLQTILSITEKGAVIESIPKAIEVFDIPIPSVDAAVNPNPSFELLLNNGPAAWTIVSPADVTVAQTAFRGQLSLQAVGSSESPVKAMQQFFVERGAKYRAQVWVRGYKTSGSPPALEIRFRSRTSDSYVAPEIMTSQPWSGSYEWQRLVIEFRTPSNVDTTLEVRLSFAGKGTVWFDYCVVEPLK